MLSGFEQLPLLIGEIGRVGFSCLHTPYSVPVSPHSQTLSYEYEG